MTAHRAPKAAPKGQASSKAKAAPKAQAAQKAKAQAAPPARAERQLDPFQIVDSSFVAGAASLASLPSPASAEVAFAGRSNVGKSSLINTLVERKGLVRTSSNPGSTRQINFYEARARDGAVFQLVDLPGYGFTRRSKAEQAAWASLIEGYLRGRVTLAAVLLLVDARRGLEEDDLELIRFLEASHGVARRPVELLLVATKVDKVPRSSLRRALDQLASAAPRTAEGALRRAVGFSSITGEGRRDLWLAIRRATLLGIGAPATSGGETATSGDAPVTSGGETATSGDETAEDG
ncbi:ribosome biogenesis GTP-binding protein YihA/YsxC [Sorangium sp. So ce1024]|uniref:ribosome biogenesis GTP-binding protein YihA/YsxC n=1 Tax=Sorangium sp. So ce1024 TaxID=3133327 RepID=UPI003F011148